MRNSAWSFLHLSDMVHQVAVGVENFEDNYSMEEMPNFFKNPDLSLIVGKDEGPRPVSREAARKINYVCL